MPQITPVKLGKLVEASFAKMDQYRSGRLKFMQQYVGRFYRTTSKVDDDANKASPINLMHTAVTTLLPNLAFNNPQVKATTSILAYRDYADMLAIATSHTAKSINFKSELRMAILDAIFLAGFIKTGLAVGDRVLSMNGTDLQIGEPFAERVDPDDMILDPAARQWDEQAFMGNRYRADVDHLIETGFGDPDMLKKLAENASYSSKLERASDLSKSNKLGSDEPRRYVDLVEIYLPLENRIVTMPYKKEMTFDTFINDVGYDGPKTGPYHMLGFAPVSDNILPVAPAGIWYDLHLLGNRVARKLARQAERNKRVLAYEDDAEEDVAGIAEASDGETVRVANLNKIKEVEYGGASDNAYEWMEWVKRNFSEQAGSMDLLSGSGAGAPTATQAEMLQANTSVRLSDMQNQVYEFTGEVLGDIAFFLHTDPLIDLPLIRRKDGIEVQGNYTPEMRQGDFLDYNIDIQPFSMGRVDPNQAVRRRMEFATNVIPAAANAAGLLGQGFNVGAFLTRMAKEVGIDDADEWLNAPEMTKWVQIKMAQSLKTAAPGKAGGGDVEQAHPLDEILQQAPQMQPNQPNPNAMAQNGGITPAQESAAAAQEPQAGVQSTRSAAQNLQGNY